MTNVLHLPPGAHGDAPEPSRHAIDAPAARRACLWLLGEKDHAREQGMARTPF